MTSDMAVAEISADSPEARLMLTLTGQYVRLRVVDEQQQPVRGAQVLTPATIRSVEIGPGLFSLENGLARWSRCPSARRAWCRSANGRRWRGQPRT